MSNKIYLITKNKIKFESAKSVFDKYNIKLESCENEFPEIQANSSLEVARHTALAAVKELNAPVIREDHSIYFSAINFPGPFSAYMEEKINAKKLLKMMSSFRDKSGCFEIATVYAEPGGEEFNNVYKVPFTLSEKVKGNYKIWDSIIILKGEKRTLTEYPVEERMHIWTKGYEAVAKHISSRK